MPSRTMHWVFILLLGLSSLAPAQSLRGAIGGRVLDATGKPIPAAAIVVTSDDTSRRRETVSTPSGDFLVSLLPPGHYRVRVEKNSFETLERQVALAVNQQVDLVVELSLAGQRQQVDVPSVVPLLRTESAAGGGVITTQQILDLPLNGRNYYELALLLPGVAPPAQGSAGSVRGDFAVNVNGAREDGNNFLLDGVYNGDPKLNGVGLTSPVDAIREFEVGTTSYDASFGRNAGGQVNVVLKSGTNRLHGTAWYFMRNAALDARNYFAPAGEPDPRLQRNQFGAAVGGPLVKDRTFWFASYEARLLREGTPRVTNVPSALERNGDFTQSPGVLFVIDPFTQAPFPGNRIPVNRQHPVGRGIAALYPLPSRNVPGANFVSAPALRDNSHNGDLRLDHSFGAASEFTARYSTSDRDLFEPFAGATYAQVPGFGNYAPRRAQNAVISETHIFRPTLLNEARLSFSRVALSVTQQNQGNNLNRAVGLQQPWTNSRQDGLSYISVLGLSPLGDEFNNPQRGVTNTWFLSDSVSWMRNRSTYKFGGEIRKLEQNAFRDVQARGLIQFVGFTGNALSELLQGIPAVSAFARVDNPQYLRSESYNLFFDSSHRLRPSLTLTAGMRYEFNDPAVDKFNRANLYDPAAGSLVPAGAGNMPRAGYVADRNNFGPRVGLAWAPGRGARVYRAGYGIYFDQSSLAPGEGLYFSPPYFDFRFFISSAQAPLTLFQPFPVNSPSVLPPSGFAFQRDLRTPYLQQWSFHVQQQAGASRVLEIGYVGSKGTHLFAARDINQPAPSNGPFPLRPNFRFDDINRLESRANSNYHSLQATFTQRLHRGFSMLGSYTYGKSIDDASGFFSSAADPNFPQDSNNARLERARSNFDLRQRLSLSYSWTFWRGWQTNGIWQFNTGRPFTVALPGELDNSNTGRTQLGFGANDRPNVIGNPRLDNPTPERWFNTAAFAPSARGTFGSAGRNILDGPGYASVNLSLVKSFRLAEAASVQFRAETFNAFNRTNFLLPQAFVGAANYGAVTGAQAPRQMQLALKFLF